MVNYIDFVNFCCLFQAIGKVGLISVEQVDYVLEIVKVVFFVWKKILVWEWCGIFCKVVDIMEECCYELNVWICLEVGKIIF